jgi:hypothetical protein
VVEQGKRITKLESQLRNLLLAVVVYLVLDEWSTSGAVSLDCCVLVVAESSQLRLGAYFNAIEYQPDRMKNTHTKRSGANNAISTNARQIDDGGCRPPPRRPNTNPSYNRHTIRSVLVVGLLLLLLLLLGCITYRIRV